MEQNPLHSKAEEGIGGMWWWYKKNVILSNSARHRDTWNLWPSQRTKTEFGQPEFCHQNQDYTSYHLYNAVTFPQLMFCPLRCYGLLILFLIKKTLVYYAPIKWPSNQCCSLGGIISYHNICQWLLSKHRFVWLYVGYHTFWYMYKTNNCLANTWYHHQADFSLFRKTENQPWSPFLHLFAFCPLEYVRTFQIA